MKKYYKTISKKFFLNKVEFDIFINIITYMYYGYALI